MINPKKTILYVEDLVDAFELVEVFLSADYNIIGARNKENAITRLSHEHIDLILMDINLQRPFDGVELAMQLKKDPAMNHIPIIAVTAYAMEDDKRKILNAGMDEYISKPVSKEILLKKINSFLN